MSATTLRSLLLAARATVSTQHAANSPANAAPRAVGLLLACWAWLISAVFVGLLAFANGAERDAVAAATALAIAPSLTGFTLFPHLGRRVADLGWLAVWLTTLTGLVAGTGGAASPLAAGLLIVPALALALGRPWAPEAGAAAALGYALAAFLARYDTFAMGPYAELMTAVSIAFAAGVMALPRAQALSREAAMSQRVAEVSHELRTPLTHILGFSEMIERKIFGDISER